MYLNYSQIEALIAQGQMLNTDPECINAASLDIRLGREILIEASPGHAVDYRNRDCLSMFSHSMPDSGIFIRPGQFFLAHTIELCNLPDNIAALFRIKSSMGRMGLEHLDAGWVSTTAVRYALRQKMH